MQVEFSKEHDNPKDCQLVICITGSESFILDALTQASEALLRETTRTQFKPRQKRVIGVDGCYQVATPVWDGKNHDPK